MYSFDSDYLEGCLPEILEAFEKTNLEQTPGYGYDPYCTKAAELIKKECDCPQADVFFLVGGTQTNATVISSLLRPYQGVLCAESGHIAVHETGAIEHSGHKVLTLSASDGKICAESVRKALIEHDHNPHCVQPAMVYISQSTELGTLYSLRELKALSGVCREFGIPLYIDGARLGYALCSEVCDTTLADIASLCDVFYIGGTKQGALFGEAVVFTNPALAEDFKYSVKQNGGLLAKGRLLGLQFMTLFSDGLYLRAAKSAVEKALLIRDAFKAAGFPMFSESPTNQQFVTLPNSVIAELRKNFSFEDWQVVDSEHTAVRFCTSWATERRAVEQLILAIGSVGN